MYSVSLSSLSLSLSLFNSAPPTRPGTAAVGGNSWLGGAAVRSRPEPTRQSIIEPTSETRPRWNFYPAATLALWHMVGVRQLLASCQGTRCQLGDLAGIPSYKFEYHSVASGILRIWRFTEVYREEQRGKEDASAVPACLSPWHSLPSSRRGELNFLRVPSIFC